MWIAAIEDGDKVVFDGTNTFFCCIVAVKIWWHDLPFDIIILKEYFESFRALIV